MEVSSLECVLNSLECFLPYFDCSGQSRKKTNFYIWTKADLKKLNRILRLAVFWEFNPKTNFTFMLHVKITIAVQGARMVEEETRI